MIPATLRVLVVENDRVDAELEIAALERAGFKVHPAIVATAKEFDAALATGEFQMVLADYRLNGWTGMDALKRIQDSGREIPLIVVTGTLGDERAVECLKSGAADYVLKGNLARLPLAVQRALREAEARREQARAADLIRKLSLAVDQSPAAIFITNTQGTIEYVNRRFTEITGYTEDEALGENPRLLKSGLTPADTYRALWTRIREGRIWYGEVQNRRKGGGLYWDAVTISPIRDATGTVTHFLAVQEDITERKRIENDLREREERFRQLAENISEVFFIMDADYSETLYINPAYHKLFGRSRQSLYENPLSFMDPVLEADRPKLIDNMARVRAGEDPGPIEFQLRLPDGSVRWMFWHAIPIRNEQGQVYRVSGFALDITERRRAEEALVDNERRLRTLFETVNLIVLVLDASGNVEYLNPFALQLTGYALDEVVGRSWIQRFLPERERQHFTEVFEELLHQGLHAHHQNAIVTKAGEQRTIAWHNTVIRDALGRPSGSLSIGEDVTEHARLEAQFRQAQKMEAVGRLAGGVAHDFNNLLTVIMSYAELLRSSLPPGDARHTDLDPILQAAEAAAGLTRQLLAFSRQQVIQPRVVSIEEVVKQSEKLLRRIIGEDIDLHTELSVRPSEVLIDPGQLEQVIMNLAVNARDAMPQGGKLTIETTTLRLEANHAGPHGPTTPGDFALLAVSDTGSGMDSETLSRIFEPFFTTKEAGKGTGLGLATVYGIVKQSGGFVWVYSEPGQGATFKIYLPLVGKQVSPQAEPVATREVAGGTETVLVAEDSAAVRSVTREILQGYGYTVLEAPDGRAALVLAAKRPGPIHLLLTDVVMPEISGSQLAKDFLALRPNARVLYMSGYTEASFFGHTELGSGIAYLQKPFSQESLGRKVREVLDTPKAS